MFQASSESDHLRHLATSGSGSGESKMGLMDQTLALTLESGHWQADQARLKLLLEIVDKINDMIDEPKRERRLNLNPRRLGEPETQKTERFVTTGRYTHPPFPKGKAT